MAVWCCSKWGSFSSGTLQLEHDSLGAVQTWLGHICTLFSCMSHPGWAWGKQQFLQLPCGHAFSRPWTKALVAFILPCKECPDPERQPGLSLGADLLSFPMLRASDTRALGGPLILLWPCSTGLHEKPYVQFKLHEWVCPYVLVTHGIFLSCLYSCVAWQSWARAELISGAIFSWTEFPRGLASQGVVCLLRISHSKITGRWPKPNGGMTLSYSSTA